MSIDKTTVLKRIKDTFNAEAKIKNNLKLPSDIEFVISGNDVEMQILKDSVGKNMQEDKASFEGWALVLKRWGKFDKVILSWNQQMYGNDNPAYGHYQRFLFRVVNFSRDFKPWFSIKPSCLPYLAGSKIDDVTLYYLNHPSKDRSKTVPQTKEGKLEFKFTFGDWSNDLKSTTNADFLDRQLPVGVFKNNVSIVNAIFSRGKSALDIWGITKNNELLLFELKADGNNKVGIITELYFYCCVMQRIRQGQFLYEKYDIPNLSKIAKTSKIIGYFFAPKLHPLIDKPLVDYLNIGISPDMEFHHIKFSRLGGVPIDLVF